MLHDDVAFLKGAVDRSQASGIMGCFIVKGGSIYARIPALQAGATLDTGDVEFNVPADEFEAVLARIPEVRELEFDGRALKIKGGRLRAVIQCVPGEPPLLAPSDMSWQKCPPGFVVALRVASKFTGQHGWTSGIWISDGTMTAVNSKSLIEVTIPGLECQPSLLPGEVCDFLSEKQSLPSEMASDGSSISFRWANGYWVKAQLLGDKFHSDRTSKIFEAAGSEAPTELTDEWRGVFSDITALTEGSITITPQLLSGGRGPSYVEIEIETPGLPKDHKSLWDPDVLAPIVAHASAWAPSLYPGQCAFMGAIPTQLADGASVPFRGVVMGVPK